MRTRSICLLALVAAAAFSSACGDDASPNEPPTLTLSVGTQASYVVGEETVQIQATAQDPEGASVSFEVVNRPERAELQTFPSSALFSWDPITSDVTGGEPLRLIFVAEDPRGGRAEEVVNLTILAGNGTPRFSTASSTLYDPNSDQPLVFDVEVRDDDSRQVILSMPANEAPAGASFEQTGDKIGQFQWNPSDEQRRRRVHSATFVADDDQTEPVSLEVTIIMQGAAGGGACGDEELEPNDTAAEATLVYEELELFEGASICTEDDVDIYAFDTLEGDTVEALLEFVHADGDLDMTLYAPSQAGEVTVDGFGVADAWSTDDDEELTYVAEESGIYYLLVLTTGEPNGYDLAIGTTCGDDDEFGSSNHVQHMAAPMTPGDHTGLKMCAVQPDWYERHGSPDRPVLAELRVEQGVRASEVLFDVYGQDGLLETAAVNGERLELDFTPPAEGQYFYKVSGPSDMIYELTFFD